MDTAMELSFWKEEPLSPVFAGLEDQADVWKLFEEDGVAKQAPATPERDPLDTLGGRGEWLPDSPGDSQDALEDLKLENYSFQTRAQLASQLLQDLDEVLIKEEPFADPWYEQKTDLPMFDELPSPTPSLGKEESLAGVGPRPFAGLSLSMPLSGYNSPVLAPAFTSPAPPAAVLVPLGAVQQQQHHQPALSLQPLHQTLHQQLQPLPVIGEAQAAVADTQTLLQEFECVFGKVEQSHGGALTPPQSPPHHQYVSNTIEYQTLTDFAALTPNQQQQQLIREVEELNSAQPVPAPAPVAVVVPVQVPDSWPSLSTSFAPPSPCTSSNSSCSYSSDSAAPGSPETDDPEWLPGGADSCAEEQESAPVGKSASAASSKKRGKRGSKPYSTEDRRIRKKEQNKNAATRYRMKKKAEVEVILGEENGLRDKNTELQAKVADLSQEIRYLKNLMREVFTRRGLIK
ncbi:hypothetical protein ONE63_006209 [Megalurothrips usitatus]|uniref:BZIP domain-containing protein n=1 Tax=Megalurothrips usitatus TaxID=439358 RepID=A0AAV7XTP7_9NEOP|nr:hypothetical protein ONE63_006209 [Megalurothrips usitatus]